MQIARGSQIQFIPASHENPDEPGVLKRVLATKEDLFRGQVMMVNWSLLPDGKSFEPHYHEDMQEVFVILNGTVTMTVDDQPHELRHGDAILIAPHEIHRMSNHCGEAVEYIVFGVSTEQDGKTVVVQSSQP